MRQLLPHYFISTHPIGWKCSDCGRIFRIPPAMSNESKQQPEAAVSKDFEAHVCSAGESSHRSKHQNA